MDLKSYILEGEKIAGGVSKLGKLIGVHPNAITDAKRGARGIPELACWELAQLIGEDERPVLAANALVTEKDERKRDAWKRHFQRFGQRLAIFIALGNVVGIDANLKMTPTADQALLSPTVTKSVICIMLNLILKAATRKIKSSLASIGFQTPQRLLICGV